MQKSIMLSFAMAFIIIGLVIENKVFYFLSILLIFIFLSSKTLSLKLESFLEKIVSKIGDFLSKIFLAISFFCVVVPVGFLYKKKHNNPLLLKKESLKTTFISRKKEFDKDSLKNIW